jgi:hypothetical protein
MPSRQQPKKLFNADVLGKVEQGIEMLVLAQRLSIDFNFERRFRESIAEESDCSRGVVLPGSPEKSLCGRRRMKPRCPLARPRIGGNRGVNKIGTMQAERAARL